MPLIFQICFLLSFQLVLKINCKLIDFACYVILLPVWLASFIAFDSERSLGNGVINIGASLFESWYFSAEFLNQIKVYRGKNERISLKGKFHSYFEFNSCFSNWVSYQWLCATFLHALWLVQWPLPMDRQPSKSPRLHTNFPDFEPVKSRPHKIDYHWHEHEAAHPIGLARLLC